MARKKSKIEQWWMAAFLLVEAVLYTLILTGQWVVYAQYASVCLCVLYVLLHLRKANYYILGGLLCTAAADWFLVVKGGADKTTAMLFFLGAQLLYAAQLHRRARSRRMAVVRFLLTVILAALTVVVMNGHPDLLAVVSVCYYANLFVNVLSAFRSHRKDWMMPWALVLFLICDTFIGLQVASGGYLPIAEGGLLHRIIFCPFNVAWACYLPSQVLIALYGRYNRR